VCARGSDRALLCGPSTHPLAVMTEPDGKPSLNFTEEEVAALVGKHLLVGLTHRDLEDKIVSVEQFHGTVSRVNLREGLVLTLWGTSDERRLPPDLSRLEAAEPGEYRLRSTGEVVNNPDFTVLWTVYPKGYQPR
jgi:nitrogen fixation protein